MIEINVENKSILIEELKRRLSSSERFIIGIDGVNGSGKTNLAHYIASELIIDCLHIDHLLVSDLDCFLGAINFGLLKQQIKIQGQRNFIIEGCCLLDAVKTIDVSPNILIYCKEISRDTMIWSYGTNFDEYATSNSESNLSNLDKEIFKYHEQMHPWENVDFIYNLFNDLKVR